MNQNKSLVRKIAYITAIALLLIPLSRLGDPDTRTQIKDKNGNVREVGSVGGTLAVLRAENGLAQAQLGEIDPASATMKFATLGMRPIAVAWLWDRANHYKKIKDWDKLSATVEQIIRLQPNDLEVWDFQAHNLSYNVSVEFDDYRYRYEWVKKGIEFLIKGTEYNRDEPGLLNELGWFTGQKIGRSDEAKQFRRLFRDDKDFHAEFLAAGVDVERGLGYDRKPDNWLVAGLWYDKAVDSATLGRPIRGKTPLLFYSGSPMSLINGANAIEKDGYFGERAIAAWDEAARSWYGADLNPSELRQPVYGNRLIPTSAGFDIRLNDGEIVAERIKEKTAELDQLAPGARERLLAEKRAALPESMRNALDIPDEKLTPETAHLKYEAQQLTEVKHEEVARTVTGPNRLKAFQLADQLEGDAKLANYIRIYRQIVNFEYWRLRCKAEREPRTMEAREKVFNADRQLELGQNFNEIQKLYEDAWEAFAKIFVDYPDLMSNPEAEELVESIERYRDLLAQLDKSFPSDFVLNDLLDKHERGRRLRSQAKLVNEAVGETPSSKPDEERKSDDEKKPEDKQPADDKKAEGNKPEEKKPDEKASDGKQEDKPAPPKPDESSKPAEEKPDAPKSDEKKPEEPKADEPQPEVKPAAKSDN
jgi:hypothetical protein